MCDLPDTVIVAVGAIKQIADRQKVRWQDAETPKHSTRSFDILILVN